MFFARSTPKKRTKKGKKELSQFSWSFLSTNYSLAVEKRAMPKGIVHMAFYKCKRFQRIKGGFMVIEIGGQLG